MKRRYPNSGSRADREGAALGPKRRLFGEEELVQQRRHDARTGEQRLGLTAVVDLVLEQVGKRSSLDAWLRPPRAAWHAVEQ